MYEIAPRIKRAAESILESENLTADLDDTAAKVLLDWGVRCAETVAGSTDGLQDSEAEEIMSLRLRATRRLMRLVNQWAASRADTDADSHALLWTQILEQAAIIYGRDFRPPQGDQRDAFLKLTAELAANPSQMITKLREWFESPSNVSPADRGEE